MNIDVNECLDNNGWCGGTCTNRVGSHECSAASVEGDGKYL